MPPDHLAAASGEAAEGSCGRGAGILISATVIRPGTMKAAVSQKTAREDT